MNFGALSHSVNHTAIPATLHNNGNPLPLPQQTAQLNVSSRPEGPTVIQDPVLKGTE